VVEGDESDGSHLLLSPEIGILTSVEADHLDRYRDLRQIRESFALFATSVSSLLIGCVDDRGATDMLAIAPGETLSYGFSPADVHGEDYSPQPGGAEFGMFTPWGDRQVQLRMPGKHNARNALAAAAAGLRLGLDIDGIVAGLAAARLPGRRMELVAEVNGAPVYDDYGHHPTEVRATLSAAREVAGEGRVVVAFQPHRVSRLAALMGDFARAFGTRMRCSWCRSTPRVTRPSRASTAPPWPTPYCARTRNAL